MRSSRIDKNTFREVGVFIFDWFRIHAMASPTQVVNEDQIFKHTHDVAASVLPSEALLTVSSMSFHSENKQDQEYY